MLFGCNFRSRVNYDELMGKATTIAKAKSPNYDVLFSSEFLFTLYVLCKLLSCPLFSLESAKVGSFSFVVMLWPSNPLARGWEVHEW